jgi:ABC-type branched-subunit amino acid transport system substrate-binding protein
MAHRRLIAIAAIAAAVLGPTGAPREVTAQSREPIKIGVILPLTGPSAAIGQEDLKGIQFALEEAGNSIGGRPVQLVVADDQNSPNVGLTEARRLVENEKVSAVLGSLNSAVALAVHAYTTSSKVPFISGGIVRDLTDARKSPYTFRASVAAGQLEGVIAQFVVQNGWPQLILMGSDYAAGRDAVSQVGQTVKQLKGDVVAEVFPRAGETDYAPYFSRLADRKADAVYGFFFGGDTLRFVRQYKSFGLKFPLIMTDVALSAGGVSHALGKDIDGVYSVEYWYNGPHRSALEGVHRRLHQEEQHGAGGHCLLRLPAGAHHRRGTQGAERQCHGWRCVRQGDLAGFIRSAGRHVPVRRLQQPDRERLLRALVVGRRQADRDVAQDHIRHHAGLVTREMIACAAMTGVMAAQP